MKVFHHTCFSMGTRFNMVLPNMEDEACERIASGADAILTREEQRMSRYLASSEISYINSFAFEKTVKVSDEMSEILGLCSRYYKDTQGAFDPTWAGKVQKTGSKDETTFFQSEDDGFGEVAFNREQKTVRFLSSGTVLDLGGFGKGWALDKIVSYLCHNAISSAFISFGESSITAIGGHPLGGPWKVDIPHPDWNMGIWPLELQNQSVSVSGLKKKSGEDKEQLQGHIYSARTSKLVQDNQMAMVKSASAIEAEVLSTAVVASDSEQKQAIMNAFPAADFFESHFQKWRSARNLRGKNSLLEHKHKHP